MHIVILFHNIGGYHAARLRAGQSVCQRRGWQFTAIQETDNADEHPWGDLDKEITFPLETLLPAKEVPSAADRHPQATLAASKLPACLNRLQPDLLVIPGWGYPVSRTAIKWARQHRRPTVLMSESKWDDEPRVWWKETLKSLLYTRKFKSAIVGGQLHKDYLVKLGFSKNAIFQGYDVVDNDYFTEKAEQARSQAQTIYQKYPKIPVKPYFITVNRFIPRKNLLRLIEAYAHYRKAINPEHAWDIVICGSGKEEANIRSHIQTYHLENNIHLPGFQTYQDIPYWFGLAKAFIHPALSEQWGLVVNEALAAGLPALVSNRCGCYPELIVENVNGFGFDPENPQQLTELMLKMSSGEIDLEKMSQASLKHIHKFSPDHFGEGFRQAVQYALAHS